MKKQLRIVILILALVLIASMFTACSLTEVVTGLKNAVIKVGGTIGGLIGAQPEIPEDPGCKHEWFAPTCTAPQTCSICRETKGEPLGHTEAVDAAVQATCTEDGRTEGKHCSVCNAVIVAQEIVKAEGHRLSSEVKKEPNCTESGIRAFKCSVCDHSYEEEIGALGHDFESITVENTCSTTGYTSHICKVCSYEYRDAFTDPTDERHEYGEGVVTLPARCGVKGTIRYDCTIEGCDHYKEEDIAPLEHHYADHVEPTSCTQYGYTMHICDQPGCTYSYMDTLVDPIGHDYEGVTVAPDCTEMGYTVYTCKHEGCGDTYRDNYTAPEHSFTSIITEPNCTERGYTAHTCGKCASVLIDTYTDIVPDAHIFDDDCDEECNKCGLLRDPVCEHIGSSTNPFVLTAQNSDWNSVFENLSRANIKLGEDLTDGMVITDGQTVTIDLNDHNITASEEGHTIVVKNGAKLIINGNADLTSDKYGEAVIFIEAGGEAIVNSGNIGCVNSGNGCWYSIENEGKLTLGKDVYIDVTNSEGASMIVNRGGAELVIDGGYYRTDGSACIKIEGGSVTINDGTFISSSGQCIMNYGSLTVNGGNFSLSGRTAGVANAIINNNTGGSTAIYGGVFRNEVPSQSTGSDFIIYTTNTNVNIYGGDFLTIGRLFRSGSAMPNIHGGSFVYKSAGNFKSLANHNIYDYMKDDTTIRRIFSAEEPDYDAAYVSVSPTGQYCYYKDIEFNSGLSDGYVYYIYEKGTLERSLMYYAAITVYYMNEQAEFNIVSNKEGYSLIKEAVDVGDSGAYKAYKMYCNGDPSTAVAQIGDRLYANFADAIYHVGEGETVVLLTDCAYSSTAYDYDEYNFTIDLNGKTLTLSKDDITMSADKTLTIIDSGSTGKIAGPEMLSAGKGKLVIKGGTISCPLNASTGGFIEIDLTNVTLEGTPTCVGTYNIDTSSYIGRGYASVDNGDGTWSVKIADGYKSASSLTMQSGYVEIFDGGKYYAVNITDASQLEAYKGRVYNANLTGIDPTEYIAEGYAVKVTTSTMVFTAAPAPTAALSGTYTTPIEGLRSNYMTYQNGSYFTVTSITEKKVKTTYAGKITGGVFTAEKQAWNPDGALAEGYEWQEQADGTFKVVKSSS